MFEKVKPEINNQFMELIDKFVSQCEGRIPPKLLEIYQWQTNINALTYNPNDPSNNILLLQCLSFLQLELEFIMNDVKYHSLNASLQFLHHQLIVGTIWFIIVANDIVLESKCFVKWLNKYNDLKLSAFFPFFNFEK